VSARAGAGISTRPDPLAAGVEAAGETAQQIGGAEVDLAVVFASGTNLRAPEAVLEGVRSALAPGALVGCAAGGVLGAGRELESGSAVAVWAARFSGTGAAETFHVTMGEDGDTIDGLPPLAGSSGVILLTDPYSFSPDLALAELAAHAPAVPVLGGLASGRTPAGGSALFVGDRVYEEGAAGVRLRGIEMLPCVSQGAAPVGRELTITAAESNIIYELAGRPALDSVEQIVGELTQRERVLLSEGLLIGIVIESGHPEYEQGDFLVRGVLGADPESRGLIVGAPVQEGQIVRLHARDAQSADEDLRRALRLRVEALAGEPPAGAIVFSCNGRGRAMFGTPDHDALAISEELGGAPTAGFFAAGEIGPVGGRSFLHGFTATIAVFPS
jgi:small ligand-binding sensory domain FIST